MNTIYETGFGKSAIGQRAKSIYEANVIPTLTPEDIGKYLVIDTETGAFELDADSYQASRRASQKHPESDARYQVRVGFRTTFNAWRLPSPALEKNI